MKVLMVSTVYGSGSIGRIMADIKHLLEKRGDECIAVYGRGTSTEKDTINIGTKTDLYFHALATRITDKTGFYSKKNTKKLINIIEKERPDIIHLHNLHGYYLNIEILFEYLSTSHIPVVWTLHDCWAFTGHCPHFSSINCEKWKTGCYSCPRKQEYPTSVIMDHSKKNYIEKKRIFTTLEKMCITTPSHWLAETVAQSFLSNYQIEVINNAIDLNIFKPTSGNFREVRKLQNKKIVLGVANVWNERKRLDLFERWACELPDDYQIVLVGLNSKQIHNLPLNIIGIERTESMSELIGLYSTADVFVNPSKEETFGMTTLEALACGTPVIVSNETAVPEVGDDSCQLIAMNDGMYQSLIQKICEEKPFTKESCMNRAKVFDKNIVFIKYLQLYEKIVFDTKLRDEQ